MSSTGDAGAGAIALGTIASIRRYPVKGMGGESLAAVALDTRGLVGDRWYAVADADGRFASGKATTRFRRHDEVFAYTASTTDAGVAVAHADGTWHAGDPALDAHLSESMGEPMTVAAEAAVMHFDASPVSIVGTATLDWFEAELDVDADSRRLRANLVIATDEPFAEEGWVGRQIRVGSTVLEVVKRIERCRTIDVAQDGAAAERRWLAPLAKSRDMCAGVYAEVVRPGRITVGDDVAPALV